MKTSNNKTLEIRTLYLGLFIGFLMIFFGIVGLNSTEKITGTVTQKEFTQGYSVYTPKQVKSVLLPYLHNEIIPAKTTHYPPEYFVLIHSFDCSDQIRVNIVLAQFNKIRAGDKVEMKIPRKECKG